MQPNDSQLLERWRQGDQASGEVLFERYYHAVERFFINKLSVTDVGDMVQETFKACVERQNKVGANKFRSYLFATAYYVLCGHLRRQYRHGHDIDVDTQSVRDMSSSPTSVVVHKREQRLLLEALRNIPLQYQLILELHYWEEMKTADIGELLSLPTGTVRSRMRRARELLEDAMARLAQSAAVLESTISHLDDWAHQCRLQLT